jgi:hypothetical protein
MHLFQQPEGNPIRLSMSEFLPGLCRTIHAGTDKLRVIDDFKSTIQSGFKNQQAEHCGISIEKFLPCI